MATTPDPAPDRLFSMDALRRAWRVVRRSGPSPGIDGVRLKDFEQQLDIELMRLRDDVLSGNYRPRPVKRYYMTKASGKKRPISIWSVRDRVAQRVVNDYLTPILESNFLDCSYGYRPGRSIPEAVTAIVAARDHNLRWVVDADIADCFTSIPLHLLMMQVRTAVPSSLAVHLIELWLNTPVHKQARTIAGVSQGGVISPLLANLYLHRFDQTIQAMLPEARLVRFADDFVILCRKKREAEWALAVAGRTLANLKLKLNSQKSRVVHFEQGFTFLGVTFKNHQHSPLPGNTPREHP